MKTIQSIFLFAFLLAALNLGAQTPAQNKETATKIIKAIDAGDVETFAKYVSPTLDEHMPAPPGFEGKTDFEVAKTMIASNHVAFPDSKTTIEKIVAEGDLVMVYTTWTATNKGPFMGKPATNKSVKINCVEIVQFDASGKAIKHWNVSDELGMMKQLGMMHHEK